jgi:hypothetical protein
MRRVLLPLAMALALVGTTAGMTAATTPAYAGLWSSTYQAGLTSCDAGSLDSNGFCVIGDLPVELGVKFTTSTPVLIQGVRVYRTDSGTMTGSLWSSGGTLLATGTFASYAGTYGWQDLIFAQPVAIVPGQTYIASYYAPTSVYAFQHDYFGTSLTVGPLTALASVTSDPNGVYCYGGCFPTGSFRDSNYWVTPLYSYNFTGFFQPVDNGIFNKAKAGSAIPVKFSLDGDQGLGIFMVGYPKAIPIACPSASAPSDPIEETVTAGGSSLTYDSLSDQYSYVWKTSKSWANKCYQFDLGLVDGSSHTFDVILTK